MNIRVLIYFFIGLLIVALGYWLSTHVEKRTEEIYVGFHGEAKRNSLLAAKRFLTRMGFPAQTVSGAIRSNLPPVGSTLLISTQRTTASKRDNFDLLNWVQNGGHLIVTARHDNLEDSAQPIEDELLNNLGIEVFMNDFSAQEGDVPPDESVIEMTIPGTNKALQVSLDPNYKLTVTHLDNGWVMEDDYGIQFIHMPVNNGYITVVSDLDCIMNSNIGDYDHAEFLWHLVNLERPARQIWLLHSDDMPPLWLWLWRHGALMIITLALLLGLWLSSALSRFGPLASLPAPNRHRLMEHIEASGRFLWRHGDIEQLCSGFEAALRDRAQSQYPSREKQPRPANLTHPEDFTRYIQKLALKRKSL